MQIEIAMHRSMLKLVNVLFGQENMHRILLHILYFYPDQPLRNEMYQNYSFAKFLLFQYIYCRDIWPTRSFSVDRLDNEFTVGVNKSFGHECYGVQSMKKGAQLAS